MANIVLRHLSDSDRLIQAVESLGYELDRKWSPGERHWGNRTAENFGFNLCIICDHDLPVGDCLEEALQEMEEIHEDLSALGLSLSGCSLDIGVMEDSEFFTRTVRLSVDQSLRLAHLGVDFEATFYPSSREEP